MHCAFNALLAEEHRPQNTLASSPELSLWVFGSLFLGNCLRSPLRGWGGGSLFCCIAIGLAVGLLAIGLGGRLLAATTPATADAAEDAAEDPEHCPDGEQHDLQQDVQHDELVANEQHEIAQSLGDQSLVAGQLFLKILDEADCRLVRGLICFLGVLNDQRLHLHISSVCLS